MKRILLALTVLLLFTLVGCDTRTTKTCQDGYELRNGVGYQYCGEITTTTTVTEPELQRYRVKVVEITTGNDEGEVCYIVEKYNYTVNGIYVLETEQEFQLNELIYAVIIDDYTAVPFAEWLDEGGN